jgi:hypothetical protein
MNFRLVFVVLVISVASVSAREFDKPRFDPFAKPEQLQNTPAKSENTENLFADTAKLTATLRAGNNSMVSIQGKIVLLGEEIEGYKLVEVTDRTAIFINDDDQRILLTLDNQ